MLKILNMNFELPREIQIEETECYKTFSQDIDYLIEFFTDLDDLIYNNGRIISFFSKSKIYTLDATLIKSSAQTLKSIKLCCSIGSFSDANALTRKLRDDLLQYIYILNIINLHQPLLEESITNINVENLKEFSNSILKVKYNNSLTFDEQAVTAWFQNSVSDLKGPIKMKLDFKNYMKVFEENLKIRRILIDYNLGGYWKNLSGILNDYVHNNGALFPRHNTISANDKNLEAHLKNINIRTASIASFFLVLLLMIESSLISSTDYIDHLDCDMEPPEDSQYSVASFVQDFIDKKVSKLHPELKQYLQDKNINGMKID